MTALASKLTFYCILGSVALAISPPLLRAQATAPAAAAPTKDEVVVAIALLEKDPLVAQKRGVLPKIVNFAETSDLVMVSVDSDVLPFLADANRNRFSPLLMTSFIAGNVKSQLNRKIVGDDSYAGIQMVFKTYAAIRKAEPGYVDPEIDKLIALDKEGKLQAHIDQVKARKGIK